MKRILLVEDDPALSIALSASLVRAGFDCVATPSGAEGLRLALEKTFAAVLLDVMLPDLNGRVVCERLRSVWPDAPIIMITALGHELDIVAGLHLGADDYIVKPFGFNELLARIEAVMRRRNPRSAHNAVLTFGTITINLDQRTVVKGDAVLPLSTRDFDILRFFVEHPGRVVSRHEIVPLLEHDEAGMAARLLDTYVWRLRRLIEDDPSRPAILQTVHGRGYVLRPSSEGTSHP